MIKVLLIMFGIIIGIVALPGAFITGFLAVKLLWPIVVGLFILMTPIIVAVWIGIKIGKKK